MSGACDRRGRRAIDENVTRSSLLALLIGIGVPGPEAGASQTAGLDVGVPPGRLIEIGGRKLHRTGAGSPTVVLESGAGSFALESAGIRPRR